MSFLKTMFNSVARTFGRILAYALIGIAIYFIASKVHASPQYRMVDLSDNWTSWANITLDTDYSGSTNITTNWASYIQLKDTTTMEANKTYNYNTSLKITIIGQGDRELFSQITPYIYNGSTLTNVSDKCTISGTKSDSSSSGILTNTTHVYNANINCVGLKGTGYYPYITIQFKANTNTLLTTQKINVSSLSYSVGTDSTDANNIMNNQNQNTQSIIDANNQNTESIINNQNQNTEDITNAINNQYNVCSDYNLNLNNWNYDEGKLNSSGVVQTNSTFGTTDFLQVTANNTYTYTRNYSTGSNYCLYDKSYNKLNCTTPASTSVEITPSQDGYLRISFNKSKTNTFTGTYCYNQLEKESEQNEEIVDNLHNMLTLLQSDDSPSENNISSAFGGVNLTDETPFTNLLMFPVLIFSYFSNSMSNTCSPVVLGSLYGHELSLPCLNLPNYLGLTLWNIIDLLFVFYMIYNIAHLFIGILEDISELRSPFLRFFIKNRGVVNHD